MVEEVGTYVSANIVKWVLPSANISTGNLYLHRMQPSPDEAVCLYQYGGKGPQYTLGAKIPWTNPRLQVVVRTSTSQGVQQAFSDAKDLYNLLAAVTNATLSGTLYLAIRPTGEPQELGPDPSNRNRAVMNFDVMKAVS